MIGDSCYYVCVQHYYYFPAAISLRMGFPTKHGHVHIALSLFTYCYKPQL